MLELEFIVLGQLLCAGEIGRLTFLFKLDFFTERIFQSALDEIDRKIGDVDADPLAPKFLRRVNGRAASAKRIEHYISGICGGGDYPLHESQRLLCGVPKTLIRKIVHRPDVRPDVLEGNAG